MIPTIGIMHEGSDGSSKFIFDLMEPERPRSIARCWTLSRATFSIQPTLSFAATAFAGSIRRWRGWWWRRFRHSKSSMPIGRSVGKQSNHGPDCGTELIFDFRHCASMEDPQLARRQIADLAGQNYLDRRQSRQFQDLLYRHAGHLVQKLRPKIPGTVGESGRRRDPALLPIFSPFISCFRRVFRGQKKSR